MPKPLLALLVALTLRAVLPAGAAEAPAIAHQLPSGEQWLVHFVRDVLPFWSSPEALGKPVGRFPTFRYPDGEAVGAGELLRPQYRGLNENQPWLALRLDRSYTRMISRQTFVLGVAYHLTGDGRNLAWAKAGVDHILGDLMDEEGSFCSWVEDGACRPAPAQRTTQDLAYAMLGPAFYAYLTGDPEVLDALVRARKALFDAHRDPESGLLRWVNEASEDPPDRYSPEQLELVAQLDQVNAYLLLLAPQLSGEEGEAWRRDLAAIARALLERFYAPEDNVFWGRIDAPEYRRLGGHHHTDTGHTAKALWMLGRTARLVGDETMAAVARRGALELVESVFRGDLGCWSGGWKEDGSLHGCAIWWAFAEVDQLAATLALEHPAAARHLPRTYAFWMNHFVDYQQGGIWPFPVDPDEQPPIFKAHLWLNGYHAAEHALIGYITSNALRGEPVSLYFAPPTASRLGEAEETSQAAAPAPVELQLRPYLFGGTAEPGPRRPLGQVPGHDRLEVQFTGIH